MQLSHQLNRVMRQASKVSHLPWLARWAPDPRAELAIEHLAGFKKAQALAFEGARTIAGMMTEGWTEQQAASLLATWLGDHGVKSFFHYPYAWYGERTRFNGINRKLYHQFMPTARRLRADDVYILDVAPIVGGYTCDIGYTGSLNPHAELAEAQVFLKTLRADIKDLFSTQQHGADIWNAIDQKILAAGYDNIHKLYPFSVLGHRLHRTGEKAGHLKLLNFGWHSYWALSARGVFGQLMNQNFIGNLDGLWAIEPHIGRPDFGAKFEEILVVKDGAAEWLADTEV